jgi:GNAT superfamily N-acetyltransferase
MKRNKYKIIAKKICQLTEQEFEQLHRLTFRPSGGSALANLLLDAKIKLGQGKSPTWPVCVALLDNKIVGWSASSRVMTCKKKSFSNIGVYVNSKYRRKGLAKRLIKRLIHECGITYAYPHDAKSKAFFKSLGFYQKDLKKPSLSSIWKHDVI